VVWNGETVVTLSIDTSHAVGSAALARDGVVLGEKRFDQPSSHLVELSRAVEALLADHSLAARHIDRVAVVLGPGSFTGVRIGLAFAKGLAATGTEMVGMSSLELLARPFIEEGSVCVCAMIDAKREEVFAAMYSPATGGSTPPSVVETVAARAESPSTFVESLRATPDVFVGTGALQHRELIVARFPRAGVADRLRATPSTAYFASIAHLLPPYARDTIRTLEPVYVRPSGAERMRLRSHRRPPESNGNA
jgi:tRNA threonylcarbamoyl adenosine modification protein YeaZ